MRTEVTYLLVQNFGGARVGLEECIWRYAEKYSQDILMHILEWERENENIRYRTRQMITS